MESHENDAGNAREMEGNTRELQGNAREMQGNEKTEDQTKGLPSGKVVFDQIVATLRENDAAKRELYREIRTQLKENVGITIDPEPYLERWLGERQDKKNKIEDIEMPLREIAENVIQMLDDGYAPSQIATYMGIYPSEVSRIKADRPRWEKEISNFKKQHIVNNKKLPWYIRAAARLKLI